MSMKLYQLHLCSTCVLRGSECYGLIQAFLYYAEAVKSFAVLCGYDGHSLMFYPLTR